MGGEGESPPLDPVLGGRRDFDGVCVARAKLTKSECAHLAGLVGGRVTAERMTAEERRERGRKGAWIRWARWKEALRSAIPEKNCEYCGHLFSKKKGESKRVWEARRFCSSRCFQSVGWLGHHKGENITKERVEMMKREIRERREHAAGLDQGRKEGVERDGWDSASVAPDFD